MDKKRRLTNKYILLAILLIAVFVLPSCRTRISNNSEIANVQYDEDGMMSETYQERRDELGLSTAEKPLLPNLGSAETDNNDDFAEGSESIDYNPEDFQEDFSEPETTTETNTNTNTNTNTGTRTTTRRTPTTTRRTTGTTTSTVSVTFNANGGTIDGKKSKTVSIKKGNKIGTLPTPKHENANMAFEGWFTKKDGGSSVKSTDKVSSSTILYAHWKDNTPEVKYYTITINPDNGSDPITKEIKEGETYTLSSKDKPSKTGNRFVCWKDEAGNEYIPGDVVDAQKTLTAQWRDWNDIYATAADNQSGKTCFIIGTSDKKATFVGGCSCEVTENDEEAFDFAIVFDDDPKAAYETYSADPKYSGKLIALSNKAISSDGYDQLLYKIVLLEKVYGDKIYEDKLKYQDAENDIGKKADFKS